MWPYLNRVDGEPPATTGGRVEAWQNEVCPLEDLFEPSRDQFGAPITQLIDTTRVTDAVEWSRGCTTATLTPPSFERTAAIGRRERLGGGRERSEVGSKETLVSVTTTDTTTGPPLVNRPPDAAVARRRGARTT